MYNDDNQNIIVIKKKRCVNVRWQSKICLIQPHLKYQPNVNRNSHR